MKKQKLTLEIPYLSTSIYGIKYDLETFFKIYKPSYVLQIKISMEFKGEIYGKGAFGRIKLDNKRILFDLQDNPGVYDFYDGYDLVLKRCYSIDLSYSKNIIPYGLRFDIFTSITNIFLNNPVSFFRDSKNFKELNRTIFNFLGFNYAGYNNLKRTWSNLYSPSSPIVESKKVLYSTRLWNGLERGESISKERQQIYEILHQRNDVLLCTLNQLNQSEYFEKLKQSNIVVINNGLHDVPGLRFSELLVMGKVVITLPIKIVVPNLVKGQHFIEAEISELSNVIDVLSFAEIQRISNNAKEYALKNLGPGSRLHNLLF